MSLYPFGMVLDEMQTPAPVSTVIDDINAFLRRITQWIGNAINNALGNYAPRDIINFLFVDQPIVLAFLVSAMIITAVVVIIKRRKHRKQEEQSQVSPTLEEAEKQVEPTSEEPKMVPSNVATSSVETPLGNIQKKFVFCPNCGEKLPQLSVKFCPFCGTSLGEQKGVTPEKPVQEPKAVSNLKEKRIIQQKGPHSQPHKKSRLIAVSLLVIVMLSVVGIGLYRFLPPSPFVAPPVPELDILEGAVLYEGDYPPIVKFSYTTADGIEITDMNVYDGLVFLFVEAGTPRTQVLNVVQPLGGELVMELPKVGFYWVRCEEGMEKVLYGTRDDPLVVDVFPLFPITAKSTVWVDATYPGWALDSIESRALNSGIVVIDNWDTDHGGEVSKTVSEQEGAEFVSKTEVHVGVHENFTDENGNGKYDEGEPFIDENENKEWDSYLLQDSTIVAILVAALEAKKSNRVTVVDLSAGPVSDLPLADRHGCTSEDCTKAKWKQFKFFETIFQVLSWAGPEYLDHVLVTIAASNEGLDITKVLYDLRAKSVYNFSGLGYPSGDPHKAFAAGAATELAPSSTSWAELTNLEYQKLWSSDDVRHSKSMSVNDQYGLMLFRFKLDPRETCVKKIVLSFEGYGAAPAGNGVTIKLWNHTASAWQQVQTGSGSGDETISITISANWPDFIDSNGYVWLLARTTNPSNGSTPAVLYCDFVQCTITYCDPVIIAGGLDENNQRFKIFNTSENPDDIIYAPTTEEGGTSIATAEITGLVAALAARRPDLNSTQIKEVILKAAPVINTYRTKPNLEEALAKAEELYPLPVSPLKVSAAANPSSGTAPLTVSFSVNASGGSPPYTYLWNFDDGSTSSQQNPVHTYASEGTYTAQVTVTDTMGQTASKGVAVQVTQGEVELIPELRNVTLVRIDPVVCKFVQSDLPAVEYDGCYVCTGSVTFDFGGVVIPSGTMIWLYIGNVVDDKVGDLWFSNPFVFIESTGPVHNVTFELTGSSAYYFQNTKPPCPATEPLNGLCLWFLPEPTLPGETPQVNYLDFNVTIPIVCEDC